jgi:hypothetical protein
VHCENGIRPSDLPSAVLLGYRADQAVRARRSRAYDPAVSKIAPPLTQRQAARIEPVGLLADDPASLLSAWDIVEAFWSDTVAKTLRLGEEQVNERVNGEWSFIQTLRHLINVTDAWIGEVVLEKPSPMTRSVFRPTSSRPDQNLVLTSKHTHPSRMCSTCVAVE